MSIDRIKIKMFELVGQTVEAKVNIGRNKYEEFVGVILEIYPSLFTIKVNDETKSFSYVDILTKNIVIKLLNT